jgi:histidyl-tRNA synthetase
VIGAQDSAADVEVIVFAAELLRTLGIEKMVRLHLNTLGDSESREAWRSALVAHFSKFRSALTEESRRRLDTNPLRILDSKDSEDQEISQSAPRIDEFLTREAESFFKKVQDGLKNAGIDFYRNSSLVRGLDYYRHTAFEFVTDELGTQGTVIGGGRYDGLIETMGGPPTPAIGWAGGIERMAMLLGPPRGAPEIMAVVPENERAEMLAQRIAFELRKRRVLVDYLYRGSARKRLEKYQRRGLTTAIFVDVPEAAAEIVGTLNIKNFARVRYSSQARIQKNLSMLFEVIQEFDVQKEGALEGRRFDFVLRRKAK